MYHDIYVKGSISEQWRIKSYWLELNFNIEDIGLEFEWFLSKPKDMWQRAFLDNLNEVIREWCFEFCESNNLIVLKEEKEYPVSWDALYWSVMKILIDWVNEINERWDSLFLVKTKDQQLRKVKRDRKWKEQELSKMKEESQRIDVEIEKQRAINEVKYNALQNLANEVPIRVQTPPVVQSAPVIQTQTNQTKPSNPRRRKRVAKEMDPKYLF